MTTALVYCAPELLSCLATVAICYLMIAAYAILHDGATLPQGLLWLVYKPFAWLSAQAKSAATNVSATSSAASSSAGNFSANEIAALKKLAHDVATDTASIVHGGVRSDSANVAAAGATESPNPSSPPVAASSPQNAGRIPS
jgi:hypothetical protein